MDTQRSRVGSISSVSSGKSLRVQPKASPNLVFGVPIAVAKLKGKSKADVPLIVEDCVKYIETKGLSTNRIFLQSASALHVEKLRKAYDTERVVFLSKVTDPHIISSLLKLYIANLPDPLIPYELFEDFNANVSDPQLFTEDLVMRFSRIPLDNRLVIKSICGLLCKVSANSHVNHMTSLKLAEIFAAIMFAQTSIPQSAVIALEFIILNLDVVYKGSSKLLQTQSRSSTSSDMVSPRSEISPSHSEDVLSSRSEFHTTTIEDPKFDKNLTQKRSLYGVRSSSSLYGPAIRGFKTPISPSSILSAAKRVDDSKTDPLYNAGNGVENQSENRGEFPSPAQDKLRDLRVDGLNLQTPPKSPNSARDKKSPSLRIYDSHNGINTNLRRSLSFHEPMKTEYGNSTNTETSVIPDFCRSINESKFSVNAPKSCLFSPVKASTSHSPHRQEIPIFQQAAEGKLDSPDLGTKVAFLGDLTKMVEDLRRDRDYERSLRIKMEEKYKILEQKLALVDASFLSRDGIQSPPTMDAETQTQPS
eukprot:TRINITY_DN6403_c0_g1_i1.p1 TRINITY_DN6403_c0_g1~~TRINITY_DN6403_c0_g1_i1.p1  ORF type:complete len:532 (+),score=84.07 TRINITY_DN6403_c0_g1_i1:52-1647(+)